MLNPHLLAPGLGPGRPLSLSTNSGPAGARPPSGTPPVPGRGSSASVLMDLGPSVHPLSGPYGNPLDYARGSKEDQQTR